MLNDDHIQTTITRIIYKNPFEADIQSVDIELLNSFPVHEIVSVLRGNFHKEKDIIAKSKIYDAILSIKKFDTVQFLLDEFEQSSIDWQIVYCGSLSQYHDSRAIAKLCEVILVNPDSDVRYVAAESLAEIGDTSAITVLEYAQDNDIGEDFEGFPVAEMARDAIAKIKNRIDL